MLAFPSPAVEFPLGAIFGNVPGVTVQLEGLVPQDDMLIPYCWVRGVGPNEGWEFDVRREP